LAQVRTAAGPLRVLRVPMPARQAGKWFSYTTALLVNRSVLLPRYEHVSADIAERAHQVYRDALPGWQIVTIHADALVLKDGSLRQACLPLVHRQPDS
jgi:agmatine/peptidylarginine deiminase